MRVLLVASETYPTHQEQWAKLGIHASYVPHVRILSVLNDPIARQAYLAEAIVVISDYTRDISLRAVDAVTLAARLRQLDDAIAMIDGRKWNALPILVLVAGWLDYFDGHNAAVRLAADGERPVEVHDIERPSEFGGAHIETAIQEYRTQLLEEMDDLGFIVTYEHGRYRVGPAFQRRGEVIGQFYYGPADRRGAAYVTVHRDLLGVQFEVEQFEYLINKKDVLERELQMFFEQNPHFLSAVAKPLPHVQFRDPAGRLLVPDFILKPIVASERDSRWDIIDLKRPQASLLVGAGARKRMSHEVAVAIRQLRDYGDYFADPRNATQIEQKLGHRLQRPKLGVLIGRLRGLDVEALESEQHRVNDVRIITYDEILESQRSLVT
jgi:hypothetical protein